MEELMDFLGETVFAEIMSLSKNAVILVAGPQGPTGKSWTKRKLNELGFTNVRELYEFKGYTPVDYVIALNNFIH